MKLVLALATLLVSTAVSAVAPPAVKWSNEQALSVGNLGKHLAVDAAGAAYMTGGTYSTTTSCMTTTKHAPADGSVVWKKDACGPYGFGYGLALDSAENVVVAGYVGTKIRVVKYANATGNVVWDQEFTREAIAIGYAVSVLPNDDLVVVGTSSATGTRHTRVLKLHGNDGSLAWEATINNGPDDNYAVAEVAPDGSTIVATRSQIDNHYRWAITKVRADGSSAWTKIVLTADGQPTSLAVDATSIYVGGVMYPTSNTQVPDLHVYKLAPDTGEIVWLRDFSTSGNDYVTRMKLDGQGALYITGNNNGAYFTAKLSTGSGASIWESRFTAEDFGDDAGLDMAFDAAGDLVVTGDSFYQSVQQARTIKYSAATGQRVWMRTDDSTKFGLGSSVVVKGSQIYMISSQGSPPTIARVMRLDTTAAQPDANAHGLWWRAPANSQSGWGMNFAQQGQTMFMTWFTYDTDGSPLWFVVSNGDRLEGNLYRGKFYRTVGPAFSSSPWDVSKVALTEVGVATFELDDDTNGVFHFKVNGVRYTHPITRQVYAAPLPTCALSSSPRGANYQDLWWASPANSEAGWGINFTHQQDIIFATWFTYGADGKPLWLVGSDVRRVPGTDQYTGKVYKTTGSAYNVTFDPTKFSIQEVGSMTLTFSGPNSGKFDYTVNGITQSKQILRQDFAAPTTVCH